MQVTPIARARRAEAVATLAAAFWDYSETVHLLPDEQARHRVLPRYLGSDCLEAQRHDLLLGAEVGGEIVGVAAWIPPGAYPIPLGRQIAQAIHLLPIAPWGAGALREARAGQSANRAAHRRDPHYWLQALGVSPLHQRMGAGRALLANGLARADEEQVGCYLSTAKAANVPYYEATGFTVLSTYHPTPTWPQVWSMWRDPQASS